ncbi:MAG TPA: hypothetical protein VFS00_25950, partial [Polyangiaceae bacterium]|nr:hypothetical protein [Polyangiaceae bacterium]
LTAFEASVDAAYRDAEGAGLLPESGEPGAEVPETPGHLPSRSPTARRPRAAALYALAVGGFGLVFGVRLLGPAAGRSAPSGAQLRSVATPLVTTSEGPLSAPRALLAPEAAPRDLAEPPQPESPPASSGAQAGPQEAPVAPAPGSAPSAAPKRRPRAVASAAGAEAQEPPAGEPAGARRSRLEARARAGRASADELRELMSVCQAAADANCIALVVPLLRRVGDEP